MKKGRRKKMPEYKLVVGSKQEQFINSKKKVQILGGGYGSGKTAALVVKAIQLAFDYPGLYVLMARSTKEKLEKTMRKEFDKWCPARVIKQKSKESITLENGSMFLFSHIRQDGKGQGLATSSVLGATFDLIVVDQLEDPEIVYKDFLDLFGRLRGTTPYQPKGEFDKRMPRSGPRWFMASLNPSANWTYKKLVRPYHVWKKSGKVEEDLLWDEEAGEPLIDLIETTTYDNRDNLPADFIKTLEASYKGQMRERFLLGKYGSYEGLVYPSVNEDIHRISKVTIREYLKKLRVTGNLRFVESYDYGLNVPSCYLLAVVDGFGNVIICDGFYERGMLLDMHQVPRIQELRNEWGVSGNNIIQADPSVAKTYSSNRGMKGNTIKDEFEALGISVNLANNNVDWGIEKVSQYLHIQKNHRNPFTGEYEAPYLFVSDECGWWFDEVAEYKWKDGMNGEKGDKPIDKDDHAMDATRYLFTDLPAFEDVVSRISVDVPTWMQWHEVDVEVNRKRNNPRHARV